ncbi:MAG: hypothetical protein LBE80_00515 [Deltaproteobacteria bacterium]|jgi:hypothetical protein|nr:hypothetical protein [Deltaproteobacteria bacterium]
MSFSKVPSKFFSYFVSEKSLFSLTLLAVLLFFLSGCGINFAIKDTRGESAPTADAESFAEIMDVPYPSVMTLERKNTFTYTRKGIQAGVISVVGHLTTDEIGAYYDSHLPDHGWQPRAEAQSGKLVSTWVKGNRVLTIIASPLTLSLGSDLRLELWVAPPHTQADLGKRVVYDSSAPSGDPVVETKPIRGGKKNGFSEEDI